MLMHRFRAIAAAAATTGAILSIAIDPPSHAAAQAPPAPPLESVAMVPQAKLVKAVAARDRNGARAERLSRLLAHRESYADTLTLAAIVYPGADAVLADRIMRCESGHDAGAQNPTSSAGGRAQYLDTTWASTPEGRAGLSRYDPVAGVMAIMRHLDHSGNDASPWYASRGCWR